MSPYLSLLKIRFRARIQYRAAAFAGMVTQFFWGFIKIMILEAFYRSTAIEPPMSFEQAVAYIWLGQAFLGLLPWNMDRDILDSIRTGAVSYELIRPLDLYSIWYVRTLAWRVAATILRCIPLLLFAALLLPILGLEEWALMPPTPLAAITWLVSLLFAVLLGCAITTIAHISLLWTISGQGVSTLLPAVVTVFSGMIIPLPLFPEWAQTLFRLLPFHALVDAPVRIFSSHLTGAPVFWLICEQAIWTVLLIGLGRLLIARGLKRLVVQGG